MTLSTQPPKGTKDWYPDEFRVRKYIFDMWRKVCVSFGYEEYLGPLVEDTAIREAKSGEDVGGSELTRLTDREGKISRLALRPEMTPTVTRMVTAQYPQLAKPVRWFSIANFYRNERPQRGRNREFWQLNVDMFGDRSEGGMLEILQLSMELMLVFEPPQDSWKLSLNHRGLINAVLDELGVATELQTQAVRTMDKFHKLNSDKFDDIMMSHGITAKQSQEIRLFLVCADVETVVESFPGLAGHESILELGGVIEKLTEMGYGEYVHFDASLMRGFDYYDGVVFEVFDMHPKNNRALFGGGRYDGLAAIFGSKDDIPAVGFAPGDETMKLFLQERGLIDEVADEQVLYYIPIVADETDKVRQRIAADLRSYGHRVEVALSSQKIGKALQYADKKGADFVILVFEDEVKIKNLKTGGEHLWHYSDQKHFSDWLSFKGLLHDVSVRKPKKMYVKVGEIWRCHLGTNIGFEQDGKGSESKRPVLVVQTFGTLLAVLPLTSGGKDNKYYHTLPDDLFVRNEVSRVVLSQMRVIDKNRLRNRIAKIPKEHLSTIKKNIIDLYDL